MFGKKKYVSKEVKEQRKFKSKLRERTVWISTRMVEGRYTVYVDGTYNSKNHKHVAKMHKRMKKAW